MQFLSLKYLWRIVFTIAGMLVTKKPVGALLGFALGFYLDVKYGPALEGLLCRRTTPPQPAVASDALAAAYELLGVRPEDDMAVIKEAYRRLISEYHPDKLAGKGVSDSVVKMATEKSQLVQAAYDLICKSRKD